MSSPYEEFRITRDSPSQGMPFIKDFPLARIPLSGISTYNGFPLSGISFYTGFPFIIEHGLFKRIVFCNVLMMFFEHMCFAHGPQASPLGTTTATTTTTTTTTTKTPIATAINNNNINTNTNTSNHDKQAVAVEKDMAACVTQLEEMSDALMLSFEALCNIYIYIYIYRYRCIFETPFCVLRGSILKKTQKALGCHL